MLLAVERRREAQRMRVHELSVETRQRWPATVRLIAGYRVADRGEMDPQLMRASSEQERIHQRPLAEPLAYRKTRLGWAAAYAGCHALAVAQVPGDWSVDQPLGFVQVA